MSGIRVWSAEQAQFAKVVRRGDGARLYGGRWNSPGRPAIYCASSLSPAKLISKYTRLTPASSAVVTWTRISSIARDSEPAQ